MELLQKIVYYLFFSCVCMGQQPNIDIKFNSRKFAFNLIKFQELGTDKTLDILNETILKNEDVRVDVQIYYYLRVLFLIDRNDSAFGQEVPDMPKNIKDKYPYYPIIFIDDMPILVLQGYEVGGLLNSKYYIKKMIEKCRLFKINKLRINPNINKEKILNSDELKVFSKKFNFKCTINEYTKYLNTYSN